MTQDGHRLSNRIALITGASRGIGAAVARRFAAEGAQVVLCARTVAGMAEVDDEIRSASGGEARATLLELDLAKGEDIDRLAPSIAERFGRLDILVANAGLLGTLTPVHQIDPAEWDRVMAVNLTANFRLIRALDPLLRASAAGRAIFVSSGVANGRAYWGSYAVSKAALETLARTWAKETKKTALRINILRPGKTRTAMRVEAYPGEDPMTLPAPDEITDCFVDLADPACTRHGEVVKGY